MFGILARSFHTATRIDPPRMTERPAKASKDWNAPRHWTKPSVATKVTRRP